VTLVVVTGEHGIVSQMVRVGPAVLERAQAWNDLPRFAEMVKRAGMDVVVLEPDASATDAPEPDCWILSDVPFAATVASGLYERLTDPSRGAGLLMVGGALSFAGQQGVGGWAAVNRSRLLPVVVDRHDDALEVPGGLRMIAGADCPAGIRETLADAPRVFGYNRVTPAPGATVMAHFDNGDLAIAAHRERRSAVFVSDLMPHWGPDFEHWAGLPAFIRMLLGLVDAK